MTLRCENSIKMDCNEDINRLNCINKLGARIAQLVQQLGYRLDNHQQGHVSIKSSMQRETIMNIFPGPEKAKLCSRYVANRCRLNSCRKW